MRVLNDVVMGMMLDRRENYSLRGHLFLILHRPKERGQFGKTKSIAYICYVYISGFGRAAGQKEKISMEKGELGKAREARNIFSNSVLFLKIISVGPGEGVLEMNELCFYLLETHFPRR